MIKIVFICCCLLHQKFERKIRCRDSEVKFVALMEELNPLEEATKFSLETLKSLSELTIYSLTEIPLEIGQFTLLESLTINNAKTNSRIKKLPSFVFLLVSRFTEEIGNLAKLQRLDLHRNEITTLPPEIGNLTSLTYLYLASNQIISIPSTIKNLVNLRQVYSVIRLRY